MKVDFGMYFVGITLLHLSTVGVAKLPHFDLVTVQHCPIALRGNNSIILDVRAQRISRSKLLMRFNLTLGIPATNDMILTMNVAKETSQGWKDNFFIIERPQFCDSLKKVIPSLYSALASQKGLRPECPLPAGNYTYCYDVQNTITPLFSPLQDGKYRVRVFLRRNDVRHFCIEGIIKIGR